MNNTEMPNHDKIQERINQEQEHISNLQERWDNAINSLYSYFEIPQNEDLNENEKLREIENKTLEKIDLNAKSIVFAFAGPGGAGKGTVKEQIKEPLNVGDIINSTTRDKRPYEIDGVHYNFVTTKELAEKTILKDESLEKIQEILKLEEKPEELTQEHLDELATLIDEQFKKGEIEEGINLYPNTDHNDNEFLNLTLRPLRGWYALSGEDLQKGAANNRISSFEESGPNLLKIGEGANTDERKFYLTYVLPEQPIATKMAERALKRDGYDQDVEKLLSTIGGRQIAEFEQMVEMLTSGEYSTKLILLVNDEGYEKDGQFITRTGDALINKIS